MSEEEVVEDFKQWQSKLHPGEELEERSWDVDVISNIKTPLKDIAGTVVLGRYAVKEAGEGKSGKWYRVIGDFIPVVENSPRKRFFDSGFYVPGCNGVYDVELTRASSFELMKVPVFAVDEERSSESCESSPNERITKTHFYVVRQQIEEILLLETGFVKSDSEHHSKGSRLLDTIYYPNGCAGDGNCKYLTVWAFDSAKSAVNVTNHAWDESNSRLVPYRK